MSWRDQIAKAALDAWFGKSVVRTPEGVPQIVYRGEHGAPVEGQTFQSRLPSLSFGDQKAANTYALDPNNYLDKVQAPRVTPGYLKIEKPIIQNRDDPFLDMSKIEDALGTRDAERIAKKFSGDIKNTNNWEENYNDRFGSVAELLKAEPRELRNLYFDTYKYLDNPAEVKLLKQRGFDGATHIGSGETATDMEYRIFDPKQYWPAIPRIYSAPPVAAGALGATAAQDQYAVPP